MRGLQIAIAVDQLANTLLAGWADETLSARSYRCQTVKRRWYYMMRLIDGIFFWQPAHCWQAYQSESKRRHLPVSYREEHGASHD